VQNDEEVVVVLVDLRPLVARQDVLEVEGVEVEVLLEPGALERRGALDVDPAEPLAGDGLDVGLALGRLSGRRDEIAAGASAQDYPAKSIRLLNPYSPGGPTDAIGRPLADKLSQALGKPVVMENRPGANGMIAFDLAARAAPDGYTLLISHVGPMAINPAMGAGARYDPVKDFAPITLLASQQLLLGVRPSLPVHTLRELFDYAR